MSETTKKITSAERIKMQDKEIEELKKQLESVLKVIAEKKPVTVENVSEMENDINPRKKVKVTSLTFGTLSLYAPNRGFLTFSHYGQTHTITYAQLCDYVNAGRNAAEKGLFYIHNKDMIDDLDLTESYKNIVSPSIVNDIIANKMSDFESLLSVIDDDSKGILADVFSKKIYDNELTDLNKIDLISRALGVNLIKKVEEMKTIDEMLTNK